VIPTTNKVYKVISTIKFKKSNNSWPPHLAPQDHTRQQKYKRGKDPTVICSSSTQQFNQQTSPSPQQQDITMSHRTDTVECANCLSVFKGLRGLTMHRNHRPDCHKAYLQLSHFKKQPASGVATSRSNQQQTKNRNSKKQRVDSSGNASSTPLLAQEDFNKETLNSFPHREMYHTNSSSGLLSVTGNTAAPNSDSEDNNSNQNSSFMELLVEEPSSGVESVEDTEGEDATTGNATDDDTPDTSLLKLYNDINSVLYSNDELPLNKFSIQEKVQVDLLRTLKQY
jgi:hypothetical protein